VKPVSFLPAARREMREAAFYYRDKASGLGNDFISEVERAVDAVAESPSTWPVFEGELRRRLVRRFPFAVLYRIDPGEIVIIAIAHLSKKPGYWRSRLRQSE